MACFGDLPPELIEYIISFFEDIEPPSVTQLFEVPSESLVLSDSHPLKCLSATCHSLRRFCFRGLFSCIKVRVGNVGELIDFVRQHGLQRQIESVVFHAMGFITDSLHDGKHCFEFDDFVKIGFFSLVEEIDPPTITIMLPPAAFQRLLNYEIHCADEWAFGINYQILQLKQPPALSLTTLSTDGQTPKSIFNVRPWSHCTFNEGSSVPAYSNFEYSHLRVPSLIYPKERRRTRYEMLHINRDFEHLTSFDIIAVLPIYHMPATCYFLNSMKQLRHLRIQLAPSLSNNVLGDPSALGKGKQEDFWIEFGASYRYLLNSINMENLKLNELDILDFANYALRAIIERCVDDRLKGWLHDGDGHWTKKT